MPRQYASVLPYFLPGSREGQKGRSLSEACLKRLKQVVKLVNQLDVAFASELHSCNQIEALRLDKSKPQKLLASGQMQKLEEFYQTVTNRKSVNAAIQSEDEIKLYLCDTECVPVWLLVSTATSRMQNRYVVLDGNIAVWDECRNRAAVFLDLGVEIIRCLEPIKVDLQQDAEDILFAVRMKLNAIKAFDPIFRYQSSFQRLHREYNSSHFFVTLLDHFLQDGDLQKNVAKAYPTISNSLRAILIATTLLVIIVCTVPTFFAWQRSPTEEGSRDDSNFWSALQTMCMQLLNLFTMMLPVSRFTPAVAWRLAWAFTTIAGFCAVAAPILYVTVPVGWSVLVSFIASAAQAAIVLQIMLNSNYPREKMA